MLGRMGVMVPLFIRNRAGPWLGLSVCSERMTHRSSANRPSRGQQLADLQAALAPRCETDTARASARRSAFSVRSSTASGRCPANSLIAGLGSKKSA